MERRLWYIKHAELKRQGLLRTSYRAIRLTDREALKTFLARQSAGKTEKGDEL
jgi:hypothetical protein